MSLNSENSKRLREIARLLPEESTTTPVSKNLKKVTQTKKLHPIETEERPDALFRELIKASADGQIPSHLLDRLKEVESNQISITNNKESSIKPSSMKPSATSEIPVHKNSEEEILYASFARLLLEEE